ncbi:hypothetical protein FIBSPDRAFT_850805 [Athelia psychrophila]|uniref:Uncharacterized protein n=1 Tax=Athelia psychrophila TaxID=1759441 RepID=A0A166T1Z2_9AGAM|nr:hypothetical protein FIBSPDRAFT_850805 [Fibularhizoctonia sp. CBS 109695]
MDTAAAKPNSPRSPPVLQVPQQDHANRVISSTVNENKNNYCDRTSFYHPHTSPVVFYRCSSICTRMDPPPRITTHTLIVVCGSSSRRESKSVKPIKRHCVSL